MTSLVSITNHFKSSARINDEQFEPSVFLENFVCHGTVRQTLNSLCAEISGSAQRAFTLTGPYGSGKSTLALFLDCLLSPAKRTRKSAMLKLDSEQSAGELLNLAFPYKCGWRVVKHLCDLSSPAPAIAETVVSALVGKSKSFQNASDAECLKGIKEAMRQRETRCDGVVLIIDELGKALDYQASKGGDLHFFQSLADAVQSATDVVVIGLLHQSFAAYARKRDSSTQDEWGKVQGRYKDFGFNPSADESLHLIGESFSVDDGLKAKLLEREQDSLDVVVENFGGHVDSLSRVLPLDPVVASLLGPLSKRSFSQNERSLFSFIATHERYGFRDYLQAKEDSVQAFSGLYRVDKLWNYLYHNLGHVIAASSDSKAWLEACDAVDRASDLPGAIHYHLTQLIALFSILGRANKLFASKIFLIEYFSSIDEYDYDTGQIEAAIQALEEKSIIIFRHNLNSYHVFRASDLDVNRLILDWVERVKSGVDWTKALPNDKLILANSHYHRTGVMRWAMCQITPDVESVMEPEPKSGVAMANFVIPLNAEVHAELVTKFSSCAALAIARPMNLDALEAATIEVLALQKLADAESETLSRDPIARTEIENREQAARETIRELFDTVFDSAQWDYRGQPLEAGTLTGKVSAIADSVFSLCPAVHNELINRTKLSGTSNSALNKLLLAILSENCNHESLGFSAEGFPPEKGIYLSCLKRKGWHTPAEEIPIAGNWFNVKSVQRLPKDHRDSYRVWSDAVAFIKGSGERVTVEQMYNFWMAPPYGMTLGVCKLWIMALFKSLERHLAFYDLDSTKNWMYIPELDEVLVEKIWRYPAEAGVRYYELADTDSSLVQQVARASELQGEQTVLAVGKSVVRKAHLLPAWVKRTSGNNLFDVSGDKHLSPLAKRFRDKVLSANDPYRLVLEDIPELFSAADNVEDEVRQCMESLSELDILLSHQFEAAVKELLGVSKPEELTARCHAVAQNASRPEIENFARRLGDWSESPTESVFEPLMALVVGVRKDSWTDDSISIGYDKLRDLCRQFRRQESFSASKDKAVRGTVPVSLIYDDGSGTLVEREQFIGLDASNLNGSSGVLTAVKDELSELSREHRVRVLMELLAEEMDPVSEPR